MNEAKVGIGHDAEWLTVLAACTAVELAWWAILWARSLAPLPLLGAYLLFASLGVGVAIVVRLLLRHSPTATRWKVVAAGALLIALGASAFLPLKYAIPHELPFWLDAPLAAGERAVFDGDPWRLLDHLLGWAAVPLDWLYGAWLPSQTVIMLLVLLSRPSPAKSRALIAYLLAWFLLGVVAAVLLSSAGPLFYDRLFGGQAFAGLGETLRQRGVWIALAESDGMYASLATARPTLVAGISAMPSIHVAIALWIWLAARALMARASVFAGLYFALIWIASVQLGWHYVSDGLVGAIGMLGLWHLSAPIQRRLALAQAATASAAGSVASIVPPPSTRSPS